MAAPKGNKHNYKKPEDRAGVNFHVRCTEREKESWKKKAKKAEVSVAKWSRALMDNASGVPTINEDIKSKGGASTDINFRCKTKDRDFWNRKADMAGMKVSEWSRALMNAA